MKKKKKKKKKKTKEKKKKTKFKKKKKKKKKIPLELQKSRLPRDLVQLSTWKGGIGILDIDTQLNSSKT